MDTVNLSNKLKRRSEYNNLDHLYCHTNTNDTGSYVRSKNASSDVDMVTVLKEIKQLKDCISLHLDLIQDQSDQLTSKDKMLMILKKENDLLKAKIEILERRNKSSNGKRNESPIVDQMIADLPEINAKQDVLKKISSKLLSNCTMKLNALSNSIEDVLEFDIDRPTADAEIDKSSSNVTDTGDGVSSNVATINNNNKNSSKNGSIIGTLADGKPISKIVLQRVVVGDVEELAIKKEGLESLVNIKNEKLSPPHLPLHVDLSNSTPDKSIKSPHSSKDSRKTTNDVAVSANVNTSNVKSETSRKNRKTNKKSKSTASENESALASTGEKHRRDEKTKAQKKIPVVEELPSQPLPQPSASQYRNSVMTTTELYLTREWQMDEIEVLVNKQITDCGEDGLNVDEINLEIPRWCEIPHDTNNGMLSSDGMEDLSDDVFIKRHARLEQAEKKRKKWDIQRIRELRTHERLSRRHCKNDIVNSDQNIEAITSFYPSPENVKFVQVADELPVVAFGEPIHVPPPLEFSLPWQHQYRDNSSPISLAATISPADHTTILFQSKKRPARRATPNHMPKIPRSSKRVRR